ncbi:hypothetical protein DU478_14460 [Thalassococcus profundi]|uniref:Uncharacterized protein n=1 Tax=Thalassococcus profundi TaxID=2282382 RepID=A0A369TMG8_9RHOB|nr:hypothetical protein [Thalassococcus profundi]RDD65635.1 hypothetical protein DU478_14460 [Thalassococcus profundi]
MTAPAEDRPRRPSLFLERRTYRRRRLMDAARLLPLLGLLLWCIPLLWPSGPEGVTSSGALTYIFCVWLGLILVAFGLALRLRSEEVDKLPEARK